MVTKNKHDATRRFDAGLFYEVLAPLVPWDGAAPPEILIELGRTIIHVDMSAKTRRISTYENQQA